ncbi:MAG: zinc-regulated TonB-dependent outer membrane receptor [Proteobacteria bacterium]|jgi:hypothetical protein|nr:zinc-regulated TonB-dependent outer membrane receptor [Pseudomonadota bacterium]
MTRQHRPILRWGLAALAALCLQGMAAHAQQDDPPDEAPQPSREQQLEERVAALERQIAALKEGKEKEQGTLQNAGEDEIDRELTVAAQADASAAARTATPEETAEEDPLALLFGKEIVGNESNPSISLILDMVGTYFSQEDRVHLGGHAPTTNGPAVTGAELAASANIDPYFKFDMAFCFSHLHLEEITFTTLALLGNLQVRGGLFLTKVGRQNNTHPHSWRFVLHPLPNQFLFGAEGLGAPGIELSWLAPLPWYVELTGALQMGEGGSFRTKPLTEGDPSFADFLYPVRLAQFFDLADDWALQIAGNAVFAPSAMGPEVGNRSYAYGGDLLLRWRPIGRGYTGYRSISLLVEGWYREMEVPGDLWRDAGGYADLAFGIAKRWEAALRGELWRRAGGDAPSEENGRAKLGLDVERGSAAVSFLPSHFSRLRLQYTFENVEGYEPNHIALLQIEVSAGAHGAHAY